MRILLDTHYLIWAFTNPEKLSPRCAALLVDEENEILFSQASLWEIAIKYATGKILLHGLSPEALLEEIELSFMRCLPLRNADLISFYKLPREHSDPFDRIMIWQCISQDLHFLTIDTAASTYVQHGLKLLTCE